MMNIINSIKKRTLATVHKRIRAIFLHTQKTAGTTLIQLARLHYGQDMISHGEYINQPISSLDHISFISGHFGYNYAESLMKSRYRFTFLRNPAERVLSFYFFGRGRKSSQYPIYQLCHQLNLEEFLSAGFTNPLVKQYIWNHQTWQLAHGWGDPTATLNEQDLLSKAVSQLEEYPQEKLLADAINHLDRFSHVGFTETFEQDRNIILRKLKLPIPSRNIVENATSNRMSFENLSSREQKLLLELTHLDQHLYQAAWEKFHGSQTQIAYPSFFQ